MYRRACFLLVVFGLCQPTLTFADAKVRMYKINKKNQQKHFSLGKDAKLSGCHEFRKNKPVYRFVQFGFTWCSIYTDVNCSKDALVTADWKGKKYRRVSFDESVPQIKLYPGDQWFVTPDQPKIRSWYCEAK